MMPEKDFYTVKEVAEKLNLKIATVYRYIKTGKIKAYKVGKRLRIKKKEIEDFMSKHIW